MRRLFGVGSKTMPLMSIRRSRSSALHALTTSGGLTAAVLRPKSVTSVTRTLIVDHDVAE